MKFFENKNKPYRIIHKLYVVDRDKILVREIREYDKG